MKIQKIEQYCTKCDSLVGHPHKTTCMRYSSQSPFVTERADRMYIAKRVKPINPALQAALEREAE